MTLSWPDRLLTLSEWEALPEAEGVRLELVEGLVVMAPTASPGTRSPSISTR